MDVWHDYPVVKDKTCLHCAAGPVHVMLTSGFLLYLHCETCGHHWTEPERRQAVRPARTSPGVQRSPE
jgi:hypothetical protein